jgi:hypothetical protein
MALELKTQRYLLNSFIASISLCGLIGIFCLLLGEMSAFVARVLGTTGTVGAASILALAAAIPWERKRWPPIGLLGVMVVAIAMVLMLVLIWFEPYSTKNVQVFLKVLFGACILAVALPHIGLLSLARLNRGYEFVRLGTVAVIALLAVLLILMLVFDIGESDLLIRLIGTLGILDVCGTIAVPILHRVSRIQSDESAVTTRLELSLTCPRCETTQVLPAGRSNCATCGLRFKIEIEEEHCPKCGYVLYLTTASNCPECGTPVLQR